MELLLKNNKNNRAMAQVLENKQNHITKLHHKNTITGSGKKYKYHWYHSG